MCCLRAKVHEVFNSVFAATSHRLLFISFTKITLLRALQLMLLLNKNSGALLTPTIEATC